MAKCWLLKSIDLDHNDDIDGELQFYKRLIELDPMRSGQYADYLKLNELK